MRAHCCAAGSPDRRCAEASYGAARWRLSLWLPVFMLSQLYAPDHVSSRTVALSQKLVTKGACTRADASGAMPAGRRVRAGRPRRGRARARGRQLPGPDHPGQRDHGHGRVDRGDLCARARLLGSARLIGNHAPLCPRSLAALYPLDLPELTLGVGSSISAPRLCVGTLPQLGVWSVCVGWADRLSGVCMAGRQVLLP